MNRCSNDIVARNKVQVVFANRALASFHSIEGLFYRFLDAFQSESIGLPPLPKVELP